MLEELGGFVKDVAGDDDFRSRFMEKRHHGGPRIHDRGSRNLGAAYYQLNMAFCFVPFSESASHALTKYPESVRLHSGSREGLEGFVYCRGARPAKRVQRLGRRAILQNAVDECPSHLRQCGGR